VPSNTDAEIELFSRGKLESDFMKAHAKQMWDNRAVQAQGTDITADADTGISQPEVEKVAGDETSDAQVDVLSAGKEVVAEVQDAEPEFKTTEEGLKYRILPDCPHLKAGRTLSARNVEILKEVIADLDELASMELTRGAKALCDRCMTRLADIVESAAPIDDEDKSEATETKSAEIELADVVNYVLGATTTELGRVKHTMDMVFNLEAFNAAGEEYRQLENQV
jgi:hypothetical protein